MGEGTHGSCLCGRVHYDVRSPEALGTCHCTRCQRWTGTGGSTVLVVAKDNLKVTKGQDSVKKYEEKGFADRYFCGHCGSGLYVSGGDKLYVGAGTCKNIDLKPAFHIQVAHKAPWDEIGGTAPQFPEWPPSA